MGNDEVLLLRFAVAVLGLDGSDECGVITFVVSTAELVVEVPCLLVVSMSAFAL